MAFWLGTPAPFASEDEARELWFVHRDRLLELFGRPGRKPLGWWKYEAPELGLTWPGYDHERSALYEVGLLTSTEVAELTAMWRREFMRAQSPDFFLALGPDQILRGQAAREAQYRWLDLPDSLLATWLEERRGRPAAEEQVEGCST
jgi:hypothetical protein